MSQGSFLNGSDGVEGLRAQARSEKDLSGERVIPTQRSLPHWMLVVFVRPSPPQGGDKVTWGDLSLPRVFTWMQRIPESRCKIMIPSVPQVTSFGDLLSDLNCGWQKRDNRMKIFVMWIFHYLSESDVFWCGSGSTEHSYDCSRHQGWKSLRSFSLPFKTRRGLWVSVHLLGWLNLHMLSSQEKPSGGWRFWCWGDIFKEPCQMAPFLCHKIICIYW